MADTSLPVKLYIGDAVHRFGLAPAATLAELKESVRRVAGAAADHTVTLEWGATRLESDLALEDAKEEVLARGDKGLLRLRAILGAPACVPASSGRCCGPKGSACCPPSSGAPRTAAETASSSASSSSSSSAASLSSSSCCSSTAKGSCCGPAGARGPSSALCDASSSASSSIRTFVAPSPLAAVVGRPSPHLWLKRLPSGATDARTVPSIDPETWEKLSEDARAKMREAFAAARRSGTPSAAPSFDAEPSSASAGAAAGGGGRGGVGLSTTSPVRSIPSARTSSSSSSSSSPYTYAGASLMAVALPMGPIGGGCVSLAGDGGLRQWQIVNQVEHTAQVPDSFFAVRTDSASAGTKAAVLMSPANYDQSGFTPAPMISDADVPASSVALLDALPSVSELSITAQFPTAVVDYVSQEYGPIALSMECLSPFIPLDSKNSNLPVVFFVFTATNPSATEPVTVSLLMSQQNCAGWDGHSSINNEVENPGYGGNVNSVFALDGLVALDMNNPTLDAANPTNGHVAAAVLPNASDTVTTLVQFDSAAALWSAFATPAAPGLPGQGRSGPSPAGRTWNGALCDTFTLAPGASQTVTFALGWHYPNRVVNWGQPGLNVADPRLGDILVGNQYANVWPTMSAVLDYARTNAPMLLGNTRLYRDTFYNSTLPWQLLDSCAPRAVVLRSPTCMWNADGNFYAFEGCGGGSGCCPLNCTHVWNYEMSLSRLFPDLELTMRTTDLQEQIAPNAIIPSRTIIPLEIRRQWTWWPNYTDIDPASTAICVDGEMGAVLKLYREVLFGASGDTLAANYPQARKVLNRWMSALDSGDGVVRGPQPNTYDCSIYGVNTFISGLYLCGLRAGAAMATLAGDSASAAAFSARFALGSANLDKYCFTNGKWYTQVVDPANPVNELTDGCFVDQLLGQWWAHLLGLGYLLPAAHVQSSVSEVFTTNHRVGFDPAAQSPRRFFDERDSGLYIGTWPNGDAPKSALLYTSEGAWSGLEYAMAGLALQEGLTDVWTTMLSDTRARQDGTRRSPWNEIECGDHYSRQMSGGVLVEIAAGQLWNAPAQTLSFAPIVNPTNFSSFCQTNTGWGSYAQTGTDATLKTGTASLTTAFGSIGFKTLQLASQATTAVVTLNGAPVACTATQSSGTLSLAFASVVAVAAGQTLKVTLSP